MIAIKLNGNLSEVPNNMTVFDLLKHHQYDHEACAVAVDQTFIPRSEYVKMSVVTDMVIDIVSAMPGG